MPLNAILAKIRPPQWTAVDSNAMFFYEVPSWFHLEGVVHISWTKSNFPKNPAFIWTTQTPQPLSPQNTASLTPQERLVYNLRNEERTFTQIDNIHLDEWNTLYVGNDAYDVTYTLMWKLYDKANEQLVRDYYQSQIDLSNHVIAGDLVISDILSGYCCP